MKLKRSFVTPYITLIFILLSISGVLMYFQVLGEYTELIHEISALLFIVFSILHVVLNWTSLKTHFLKWSIISTCLVVLAFTVVTIYIDKQQKHYSLIIKENLVTAPFDNLLTVLNVEHEEAQRRLMERNIFIGDSKNLLEIAVKNNHHPGDLLEILVK